MLRIDDGTMYNPFGPRLAELADPSVDDGRRLRLAEELVVWEAEELAHGYRHVTVAHGDPDDPAGCRRLSDFYDEVRAVVSRLEHVRVRGTAEFVTVTVQGDDADAAVAELSAVAAGFAGGEWAITGSAYPLDAVA